MKWEHAHAHTQKGNLFGDAAGEGWDGSDATTGERDQMRSVKQRRRKRFAMVDQRSTVWVRREGNQELFENKN